MIKKTDEIFLYGDNEKSFKLKEVLLKDGYMVSGIIDRKYKQCVVEEKAYRVDIELFFSMHLNTDKTIVVICLNDAIKHYTIAKELHDKGVKRIIYLPMNEKTSEYRKRVLRDNYFKLFDRDYESIEFYRWEDEYKENVDVIRYGVNTVVFYCPVELIYTPIFCDKKNISYRNLNNAELMEKYSDKQIKEVSLYTEMINFILNKEGSVEEYLLFQRNTDSERKQLLENREELFKIYENNYQKSSPFFMDSPCELEWNEKGYFNNNDGLHRCIYLYLKGESVVPAKASNADYRKYIEYYRL